MTEEEREERTEKVCGDDGVDMTADTKKWQEPLIITYTLQLRQVSENYIHELFSASIHIHNF